MDDAPAANPLAEENTRLQAQLAERDRSLAARDEQLAQHAAQLAQRDQLVAQQQGTITTLTQQRDEYYLEKLRLEIRLAKALKQVYGPRADRVGDPAQLLLDFGQQLEALPIRPEDLLPEDQAAAEPITRNRSTARRLRTRGRRDIGSMDHLPMIEQPYKLSDELCRCPRCQELRKKIGEEVSYTIERVPASFMRVKHIQYKYACPICEHEGHNPRIELAEKTQASPIDKGMAGPGLLAYIATAKYADFLPLHRLQNIFAREGFELDRSVMGLWMGDVAQLVRPVYDEMSRRVRLSHVVGTDDTVMPLWQPGKTKQARMWIYQGDASHPYNVFDFTISRSRDGPRRFLKDFHQILLADGYGGYDAIVLDHDLPRAGCWAHARRKYVEAEATAPALARTILRPIKGLFAIEAQAVDWSVEERLRLRQTESAPLIETLRTLLLAEKSQLVPKHPMAQAIGYTLNQWAELTLFLGDGAIPIHNNSAEQEMKRIALLRKNSLFVGTDHGGETAAILSSITSTCRRHGINPQLYLTQLLVNLPDTPISRLEEWLPDRWKIQMLLANQAHATPVDVTPAGSPPRV